MPAGYRFGSLHGVVPPPQMTPYVRSDIIRSGTYRGFILNHTNFQR